MNPKYKDPNPPLPHRGNYSRGFLPTIDQPGNIQMVTFRLHDSVPREVWEQWQVDLRLMPESERKVQLRAKSEAYADAGHGECLLSSARAASIMADALLARDQVDYDLLSWVVMPNHVHVLIEQSADTPLFQVVMGWKGTTSHAINRMLDRKGPIWMREYFDRYIRDDRHLHDAIRYIEMNPVKAGLCREPADWPYSSACHLGLDA